MKITFKVMVFIYMLGVTVLSSYGDTTFKTLEQKIYKDFKLKVRSDQGEDRACSKRQYAEFLEGFIGSASSVKLFQRANLQGVEYRTIDITVSREIIGVAIDVRTVGVNGLHVTCDSYNIVPAYIINNIDKYQKSINKKKRIIKKRWGITLQRQVSYTSVTSKTFDVYLSRFIYHLQEKEKQEGTVLPKFTKLEIYLIHDKAESNSIKNIANYLSVDSKNVLGTIDYIWQNHDILEAQAENSHERRMELLYIRMISNKKRIIKRRWGIIFDRQVTSDQVSSREFSSYLSAFIHSFSKKLQSKKTKSFEKFSKLHIYVVKDKANSATVDEKLHVLYVDSEHLSVLVNFLLSAR
ncbi:MAG: hypothetical protein ISR65_19170 [Bacteriovoracaceae bacterium]|nr:hypothetical protein [Bacteriovoracaceae bacterium]